VAINGWRLAFWAAVAGVSVGSLTPTTYLPPQAFDIWDKAQHTSAFVLLGGLGLLAFPQRTLRVLTGLLVYGGLIELAQAASGWRYGDWQDWLADAVGVGAAYLGWVLWKPVRSHGQMSSPQRFLTCRTICLDSVLVMRPMKSDDRCA
jgi:VanZ family protein